MPRGKTEAEKLSWATFPDWLYCHFRTYRSNCGNTSVCLWVWQLTSMLPWLLGLPMHSQYTAEKGFQYLLSSCFFWEMAFWYHLLVAGWASKSLVEARAVLGPGAQGMELWLRLRSLVLVFKASLIHTLLTFSVWLKKPAFSYLYDGTR